MKHDYVVMKLLTGDTLITILIMDDDSAFTIMFPILLKPTFNVETKKETIIGTPWNPCSNEKYFRIFKEDVVTMSPLNKQAIAYYKTLVEVNETIIDSDVEFNIENSFFIDGNDTIH